MYNFVELSTQFQLMSHNRYKNRGDSINYVDDSNKQLVVFANLQAKQSLSETVATFCEPDILDLIKSGFELRLVSNSDLVKSNETFTRPLLLDVAVSETVEVLLLSLLDTRGLIHACDGVMKSSTFAKKTDIFAK